MHADQITVADKASRNPYAYPGDTLPEMHIPDLHIGVEESPWVKYTEGVFVRYMMFDVREGTWATVLRTAGPASLGRHRHSGPVTGFTLSGSWGYREYDWVAHAGSYIRENPGAIHTLYCDDPQGVSIFFLSGGVNQAFNEKGEVIATQNVFYHIDLYRAHCEAHGLPVNQELFR